MSSLRGAVGEAARNLRHGGPAVVLELLSRAYLTAKPLAGDPVYDEDWDCLVVLDACRADLWNEVAPDTDAFGPADTRVSVAGTSTEWLSKTFDDADPDTLADTAYVTGNPYSASHVDGDAFAVFDEVWRYGWDDDLGTIPARPVTDRAIATGRERAAEYDRLVVHYMQPHFPCVPAPDADEGIALDDFGDRPLSVWEELRFGQRTHEEVWDLYRQNLEYVLEEVALLLENLDADRVVVTADHGNAMGEGYLYGHVAKVAHRGVREVPWYETHATDEGTHEPGAYERGGREEDVSERLQALGYAEE
jgi:hypothetical protein